MGGKFVPRNKLSKKAKRALNAEKREWEEIKLNEDISNPGRYIDAEGRLYLQFRNDTQDMYADIPTPLINLEGRLEHAED